MTGWFETMRARSGTIPLLAHHVARLERAALAHHVPPAPARWWRQAEAEAARAGDVVVRVQWDGRDGAVSVRPVPPAAPLGVATVPVPHPGYAHKALDREPFDRALGLAERGGAGEALLAAPDGMVAEATRFALGWLEADGVVFPPLESGVLPSIGRARVAEVAASLGLGCRTERVPVGALHGRALFLTNAVRDVLAVAALDGIVPPADPRIGLLQRRFWPRDGR